MALSTIVMTVPNRKSFFLSLFSWSARAYTGVKRQRETKEKVQSKLLNFLSKKYYSRWNPHTTAKSLLICWQICAQLLNGIRIDWKWIQLTILICIKSLTIQMCRSAKVKLMLNFIFRVKIAKITIFNFGIRISFVFKVIHISFRSTIETFNCDRELFAYDSENKVKNVLTLHVSKLWLWCKAMSWNRYEWLHKWSCSHLGWIIIIIPVRAGASNQNVCT